jgi:hypothetical protein
MDPVLRTSLIIFAAVLTKSLILGWWHRFKARQAAEPIAMKLHQGAYRAWGPIQRVQHYAWRLTQVWLGYMALLLVLLAYSKLVGPIF